MGRNRLIARMRKQKCVLWAVSGKNRHGENTYDNAIEIPCRWEDRKTEMVDADGNRVIVSSVVSIDREVALGSVLKFVKLTELEPGQDSSENPEVIKDANSVKVMQTLPNADCNKNMFVVGL